MVKPTDREIRSFRSYLKKQGFAADGLCSDVFYLYMKYGYICVSIEYNKKGEFKEVRSFLSLAWENSKCSRFYFPNYYNFGGVRKLNKIQPVHPENQPWDFFGRNDAKTETPVLWPPHVKS